MEFDRKAVEELVRGREFASQLQQYFFINGDNDHDQLATTATPLFARHLLNNVLNSFANTLLLLEKKQYSSTTDQSSQMHKRDFSFISPAKSEDSQESSPGRGCYKRRKTTQAWEKVSETPTDDGHQWRKYGQKLILNSQYARNYYRCTHKVDQRCEATKQVQRIQEKPALYKTTYYCHHTCRALQNPDDILLDPNSPPDTSSSSILLSFSSTFPTPTPTTKHDHWPLFSSSFPSLPSVKYDEEYCKEEVPSPSLDDNLVLSPHQPTLDTSTTMHATQSSMLEYSDHKDMLYGILCDSAQLDDLFQPFAGF